MAKLNSLDRKRQEQLARATEASKGDARTSSEKPKSDNEGADHFTEMFLSRQSENGVVLVDKENKRLETKGGRLFKARPSMFYVAPQIRSSLDDVAVAEMAESLRGGQLQPIKVAPAHTDGPYSGKHRVLVGNHRHAGGLLLEEQGETFELWAWLDDNEIVPEVGSAELVVMQWRENEDRNPLCLYDKIKAVNSLVTHGYSDKRIAEELGLFSRKKDGGREPNYDAVQNYKHAMDLPEEALEQIRNGAFGEDLLSAATLSKIYREDPAKGDQLTKIVATTKLPRERFLTELRKSKERTEGTINGDSQQKAKTPPTVKTALDVSGVGVELLSGEPEAGKQSLPKEISIEWRLKKGILLFNANNAPGTHQIRLSNGDVVIADFEDIKITNITY